MREPESVYYYTCYQGFTQQKELWSVVSGFVSSHTGSEKRKE